MKKTDDTSTARIIVTAMHAEAGRRGVSSYPSMTLGMFLLSVMLRCVLYGKCGSRDKSADGKRARGGHFIPMKIIYPVQPIGLTADKCIREPRELRISAQNVYVTRRALKEPRAKNGDAPSISMHLGN